MMAERSIKAGYLKDALKYLERAHEADPGDFDVMLKLGWTDNILHDDREAVRWFDLARKSPDPRSPPKPSAPGAICVRKRSASALRLGHAHLLHALARRFLLRPGQDRMEPAHLPVRPYVSARLIGDTRSHADPASPMYFPKAPSILAPGLASRPGTAPCSGARPGPASAISSHHATPDYRGGWLRALAAGSAGSSTPPPMPFPQPLRERFLVYCRIAPDTYCAGAWLPTLLERQRHRRREAAVLGQFRRNRARAPDP